MFHTLHILDMGNSIPIVYSVRVVFWDSGHADAVTVCLGLGVEEEGKGPDAEELDEELILSHLYLGGILVQCLLWFVIVAEVVCSDRMMVGRGRVLAQGMVLEHELV